MTTGAVRRVPWFALGLSVVLKAVAVGLVLATPEQQRSPDGLGFLVWAPGVLAFAIVGTVVAARRPDNAIGWLFLVVGLSEPLTVLADSDARIGGAPRSMAAASWLASLAATVNETFLGAVVLIIVLFPTGRPPSGRWWPVLGLVAGWLAILGIATMTAPGPIGGTLPLESPIALAGEAGAIALAVAELGEISAVPMIVLAVPALFLRWRGADRLERAQLKWFAYSIALLAVVVVVIVPFWELIESLPSAVDAMFTVLTVASVAAIPISAGAAILRYRLFDIDLVIRRTLVYGLVVVVLGAIYVGLVLALQVALVGVTGGETLPVALSTLAIAALFGPVRAQVREAVDRRFYRSRYRADRALGIFAARLRDQVELESVGRILVDATAQTVQPSSASVWLRSSTVR